MDGFLKALFGTALVAIALILIAYLAAAEWRLGQTLWEHLPLLGW